MPNMEEIGIDMDFVLHAAIEAGYVDGIARIIRDGANPNAVIALRPALFKSKLDHEDLEGIDNDGMSAAERAIVNGNVEILKVLVKNGSKISVKRGYHEYLDSKFRASSDLLMFAIQHQKWNKDILKVLVIELMKLKWLSLGHLYEAVKCDSLIAIEVLMEVGKLDPMQATDEGSLSVLDYAMKCGRANIVAAMRKHIMANFGAGIEHGDIPLI